VSEHKRGRVRALLLGVASLAAALAAPAPAHALASDKPFLAHFHERSTIASAAGVYFVDDKENTLGLLH
jgi:hypothetical protein